MTAQITGSDAAAGTLLCRGENSTTWDVPSYRVLYQEAISHRNYFATTNQAVPGRSRQRDTHFTAHIVLYRSPWPVHSTNNVRLTLLNEADSGE